MLVLDYNECDPAEGIHDVDCGTGAICINTIGSYSCQCDTGYTGTAPQCKGEVVKTIFCARTISFKFGQTATHSCFHNDAIFEQILIRYFCQIGNNLTTYFSFTEIETHPPLYFGMLANIFNTYLLIARETECFAVSRLSRNNEQDKKLCFLILKYRI